MVHTFFTDWFYSSTSKDSHSISLLYNKDTGHNNQAKLVGIAGYTILVNSGKSSSRRKSLILNQPSGEEWDPPECIQINIVISQETNHKKQNKIPGYVIARDKKDGAYRKTCGTYEVLTE